MLNVSLNNFLEKILIISSEMSNEIKKLNDKIDNKIDILEKRILSIENKLNITIDNENLVEIKNEIINVDKIEVIKALKYNDYRSFIYIMKLYYKNKTLISIRIIFHFS
jgi:hypothetical protein